MMMEYPVQCGCNAHVASGFFCVKIIFDNVDFQLFLTQILYLNSKRVKIGGGQELSTSQAAHHRMGKAKAKDTKEDAQK